MSQSPPWGHRDAEGGAWQWEEQSTVLGPQAVGVGAVRVPTGPGGDVYLGSAEDESGGARGRALGRPPSTHAASSRPLGRRPWKSQQERCEWVTMVTGSLIRQHHLGLLRGSGRNPCAVGLGFSPSAAGGCISKQQVVWPEG